MGGRAKSQIRNEGLTQGRPRDIEVERKIEEAASNLLAAHGYSGFSIQKLAAEAGVSKTSIYRRWKSKGELLLDLYVQDMVEPSSPTPETDVFYAIERFLKLSVVRLSDESWNNALRTIVAEAQTDPALAELLRERLIFPRRQATGKLIEAGMANGQISADVNIQLVLDFLFGPLWYRLLFGHLLFDDDFVSQLISEMRRFLTSR